MVKDMLKPSAAAALCIFATAQSLLVEYSKTHSPSGRIPYDTTSAVFFTELLKAPRGAGAKRHQPTTRMPESGAVRVTRREIEIADVGSVLSTTMCTMVTL